MRYTLLLLLVTLVMLMLVRRPQTPHFVTAHVINMDKSQDRLVEFQKGAAIAKIKVSRWAAVDGASIEEKDCNKYKIGRIIHRYTRSTKQPGVIGCFMSHRALLNHLRTLPCDGNDSHLVFEDDALIPANFWEQWEEISKELPYEWDYIQFGVTYPNIKKVRGRVHVHSRDMGNMGTFSYAVRHRSLGKICRHIEYMNDPIDGMIAAKGSEWKIYVIWPELCPHNDQSASTIRT